MSVHSFEDLAAHVGHEAEIVMHGDHDDVAIECVPCGEVLLDFDRNYHEFEEQG